MTDNPFDPDRDPELGALLRAHLEGADPAGFAARVLERLPRVGNPWEVLAGWARPGVAAALVLSAALGYWLGLAGQPAEMPAAAEVLAVEQPLDSEALMSVVLGAER